MRLPAVLTALLPLSAVLFLPLGPAFAADLDLATKIDRVTVYPDGAVVTRQGQANLSAGVSQIVLRGLPATIDPASIRVEGKGSAAFSIGAVDIRNVPGDARPAVDAVLEGKLKALRDEREVVAGRLLAAQGKKAAIDRFAQAGPDALGSDGKALAITEWANAWDAIGGGLARVAEELRLATAKARELDGEIAALERARPQAPRPGAPKRDVVVAVEAAGATQAEFTVSYRIAGAAWQPAYEARLMTGAKPVLDLTRRAEVTQRTGEDWSNVVLSVSTVRAARGTAAPELFSQQIAFQDAQVLGQMNDLMRTRAQPMAAPKPGASEAKEAEAAAAPAPVAAEPIKAIVEAGTYQASFTVPGRVTLTADGAMKALTLAQRTLEPVLSARVVPVLDETAYLDAALTNDEEVPLLPGLVTLHRDGTYIGRGRFGLVAPGDKTTLGFGADDRIKVKRVPVKKRENEPTWLGQTKTDLSEFRTTIRSLHTVPVKVTVLDRLPFSENSAITVEQLPQTTPPTEKQPGDRRGVLSWTFDALPNTEKEIRLAYRLKWPGDRDIGFSTRP
ncbi:MAG: mucoidy inhibitor MuiA family protein [Bosea sp. (in: a-proteobacteria)]